MSNKPIIHLGSIAGPCKALLDRLELRSYQRIVALAQKAVGPAYTVSGRPALMNPWFDDRRGGRRDDRARCRDVNRMFADDRVVAMVTLRGGAWLTRLLPDIDFEALRQRRRPLFLFGFSELTTLLNIAARYPRVRAYYDHDLGHLQAPDGDYRAAFCSFLQDLVALIERRGSRRQVRGQLVRGTLPEQKRIRVVGGCLTVLLALLGSRYQRSIDPRGKWLALEDIHNDAYGIDRHLAHLKLAGALQRCSGLLIGDFHLEDVEGGIEDQTRELLALLKFHLPAERKIPIIAGCNFGHCHPSGPLPINRPVTVVRRGSSRSREVLLKE